MVELPTLKVCLAPDAGVVTESCQLLPFQVKARDQKALNPLVGSQAWVAAFAQLMAVPPRVKCWATEEPPQLPEAVVTDVPAGVVPPAAVVVAAALVVAVVAAVVVVPLDAVGFEPPQAPASITSRVMPPTAKMR